MGAFWQTGQLIAAMRNALPDLLALASATVAGATGTWQPIETAPEGQHVLVALKNYGTVRAIRTGRDWWGRIAGDGEIINAPTHWMPEPAPPVPSEETPR